MTENTYLTPKLCLKNTTYCNDFAVGFSFKLTKFCVSYEIDDLSLISDQRFEKSWAVFVIIINYSCEF